MPAIAAYSTDAIAVTKAYSSQPVSEPSDASVVTMRATESPISTAVDSSAAAIATLSTAARAASVTRRSCIQTTTYRRSWKPRTETKKSALP